MRADGVPEPSNGARSDLDIDPQARFGQVLDRIPQIHARRTDEWLS